MTSTQYTAKDLGEAAREKNWDEVRVIISAQPGLVNKRYLGIPLLYRIVLNSAPRDVAESLKSATVKTVDWVAPTWFDGDCILHRIALLGYTQEMRQALRISPTNVNLQDYAGNTPLHALLYAKHSYQDHIDAARYLLEAGANANIKNNDGDTPTDVYRENECGKYNSTSKQTQKEMLMRLLQSELFIRT